MKITDREITEQRETVEVSADVDGFRLWYRVPRSSPVSGAADPFVAAALLPAMLQGRALEIAPGWPVSPKLLENLRVLQEIYHCWNPVLRIVPIEATTSPGVPLREGAVSFFSGGVDSTYTFLKRQNELTHLIFIQGFDFFANTKDSGGFAVGDIADLSWLAFKLMRPGDRLAAFLRAGLSERTRRGLSDYRSTGTVAGGLESGLAEDLEKIIAGPPVFEPKRFAGVRLRRETKELLKGGPGGGDVYRLNRLLLEDAFPLEIARRDDATYRAAIDRNARFAQSFGKTLVPVSTDHFAFGYRYNLSRNLTQGSALASIALLLGFPRAYLPGAYSYNHLIPLGQHPLTDPLWSSESVLIIHEGAEARRVDKVIRIAGSGPALANMRVCFADMNENCGKCAKCLRTMVPLKLLGAAAGAPFPPLPPLGALRKIRIANDIESIFFKENFDPGLGTADRELRRALRACLKRYERKQLLKNIDKVLLGGFMRKVYLGRSPAAEGNPRIDTTPLD